MISELVKVACGLVVVKSTVINMISNVSDLMENEAKTITNTVVQSSFVNIDETSYIRNGLLIWAWAITCEKYCDNNEQEPWRICHGCTYG